MTNKPEPPNNKIKIFFLTSAIISVAAAIFFSTYSSEESELKRKLETTSNLESYSTEKSNLKIEKEIEPKASTKAFDRNTIKLLSPKEITGLEEEKKAWKLSRGYFDKSDYSLYASYDDQTIWELANSGDLLALDIWSNHLKKLGHEEEALQTRMVAATHGSSEALVSIASTHQAQLWKSNLSKKEKMNHAKAMLMYAEVAAMRGDRNGIIHSLMELERQNIELSQDDIEKIRKAANKAYAGLESHREQLGLGTFDNTSPTLLKLQMDYMISALPNANGWAEQYIGEEPEVVRLDPKAVK